MKRILKDFRSFLIKGNAIDLAIWFMFGAAFSTLIKSFIENIIMPPISILLWKVDFSNMYFALDWKTYETLDALNKAGAPAIKYGVVITDSVSFVILWFIIFMMIKVINKFKKDEAKEVKKDPDDIVLLREIRDALMKK